MARRKNESAKDLAGTQEVHMLMSQPCVSPSVRRRQNGMAGTRG